MQVLYSDFQDEPEKDLQMLTIQSLNLAMANSLEAMGYASAMAKNTPPSLDCAPIMLHLIPWSRVFRAGSEFLDGRLPPLD
ncbi:hypothetical protein CRG98_031413 [Punica granatum]|uniref:Uncharacterized protein n=1 Tax=Punica granatum TaxID=22663 RepID=A0A2I0IVW0_PUNGR|nr:hypothetical protein CRG98_031413 [Punica granatum]